PSARSNGPRERDASLRKLLDRSFDAGEEVALVVQPIEETVSILIERGLDEGTSRAKKELLANRCLDLPNIALDLEVAHDAPGRDRYRDAGAVRRARHFGIAHLLEPLGDATSLHRIVAPSLRLRLVELETAPAEKRFGGDPVAAGDFDRCERRQLLHARFREIPGDESSAPASTGGAFEGG